MNLKKSYEVLPIGEPFLKYLGNLLKTLEEENFSNYLKAIVILPTRRAVKELKQTLLGSKEASATLFPRICAINDLDTFFPQKGKPVLSETQQLGLCLQVLKAFPKIPEKFLLETAGHLMTLLEEGITYEVDFKKLETLVPESFAEHWQATSSFLKSFLEKWNEQIEASGFQEPASYRVQALKAIEKIWAETPPDFPIIAAGLDGFIPTIQALLKRITNLPQGKVVLTLLPKNCEESVPPTHPNYLGHSFLQGVPILGRLGALTGRDHLLCELMSDTPFEERDLSAVSLEGVKLLECKTTSEEAKCIATLARYFLEEKQDTIAIVTPDEDLSIRIQEELKRWHITVDLASGRPLSKTKTGRLLLESLELGFLPQSMFSVLSFLKHPLVCFGTDSPLSFKKLVRRFEREVARTSVNPTQNLKDNLKNLQEDFNTAVKGFLALKSGKKYPLVQFLETHLVLLEKFCADKNKRCRLWEKEEGEALSNLFKTLFDHHSSFADVSYSTYVALWHFLLTREILRNPHSHPRLKLLSPLQAAYIPFNRALVCGLNEGVWPELPSQNPWLNRAMLLELGFYDPQILIGRAAALFCHALKSPDVILSYSKRRQDPVPPSRWIVRLKALAYSLAQEKALGLSLPVKTWCETLEKPKESRVLSPPLPRPCPTLRPKRLSVTDLVRLWENPYSIYAKHVLGLYPLPEVQEPFAQNSFGIWVHQILENSVAVSSLNEKTLQDLGRRFLPTTLSLEKQHLWEMQFQRFSRWILDYLQEQGRKARGTWVEHSLSYCFKVGSTSYEIVGKADRIDYLGGRDYELIDYKTGICPTKKEIQDGAAPQLPLLALLFEKSNLGTHIQKFTYVSLNEKKIVSLERGHLVEEIEEKTYALLKDYNQLETPYPVNPIASLDNSYNIYARLERTKEWLENKV